MSRSPAHETDLDVTYVYAALHAARSGIVISRVVEAQAADPRLRVVARAFRRTQILDVDQALALIRSWGLPDRGGPTTTTCAPPLVPGRLHDRQLADQLAGHADACILLARAEMIGGCGASARDLAQLRISSASHTLGVLRVLALVTSGTRPPQDLSPRQQV